MMDYEDSTYDDILTMNGDRHASNYPLKSEDVVNLLTDLGEEEWYDTRYSVNDILAKDTPTRELVNGRYKTLRKMIDFIKDANEKIEKIAVHLTVESWKEEEKRRIQKYNEKYSDSKN